MNLREELQNLPRLSLNHPSMDVLKRYLLGSEEEQVEMEAVLKERYPVLVEIGNLTIAQFSGPHIELGLNNKQAARLGVTLVLLELKEIAEQQLIDPSADPTAE